MEFPLISTASGASFASSIVMVIFLTTERRGLPLSVHCTETKEIREKEFIKKQEPLKDVRGWQFLTMKAVKLCV